MYVECARKPRLPDMRNKVHPAFQPDKPYCADERYSEHSVCSVTRTESHRLVHHAYNDSPSLVDSDVDELEPSEYATPSDRQNFLFLRLTKTHLVSQL